MWADLSFKIKIPKLIHSSVIDRRLNITSTSIIRAVLSNAIVFLYKKILLPQFVLY